MAQNATCRKRLLLAAGIVCFVSLILNSLDIWANMYALSPEGNAKILNSMFIMLVPMLIALFLILIGLLGLLIKSIRHDMVWLIVFSFTYLLVGIVTLRISHSIIHSIRNTAFHELAQRSQSLVEAIQSYEQTHGNPPDSLQQLVPEFLSEIPKTGMGGSPDYHYLSGKDATRLGGNPWAIFVKTPRGPLDCDSFIYLPLQNYPESGYKDYIEKIDDWGYVHE